MRALLINPEKKTIEVVDFTGEHQHITKLLNCSMIDHARLSTLAGQDGNKFSLFVDDEGLFNQELSLFKIAGYPQPLAGNALLLGHDGFGENLACDLTVEEVAKDVEWIVDRSNLPRCKVIGEDGNVFSILAKIKGALNDRKKYKECEAKVLACKTYESALSIMQDYVVFE